MINVRQTCSRHPSQWEGETEDGRPVYVRYKWGQLSVHVAPAPSCDIFDAVGAQPWFQAEAGEKMGSWMSLEEVCAISGLEVG